MKEPKWTEQANGYTTGFSDGTRWSRHRWNYTLAYGAIPEGVHIHHMDGDTRNDRASNLVALTPAEHAREHAGWSVAGGVWSRPCETCLVTKPATRDNWYMARGTMQWKSCRDCRNAHKRGFRIGRRARDEHDGWDTTTFHRLKRGWSLRGGVWFVPCAACGEEKPLGAESWRMSGESLSAKECRICHAADRRAARAH